MKKGGFWPSLHLPWVIEQDQAGNRIPRPFSAHGPLLALCSESLFCSLLLQMKTARTGTTTATWWSRRDSASTTTTRPPAAPPAPAWPTGRRASWGADNSPTPTRQQGSGSGRRGALGPGAPGYHPPPPRRAASGRSHHPTFRRAHPRGALRPSHGCPLASP